MEFTGIVLGLVSAALLIGGLFWITSESDDYSTLVFIVLYLVLTISGLSAPVWAKSVPQTAYWFLWTGIFLCVFGVIAVGAFAYFWLEERKPLIADVKRRLIGLRRRLPKDLKSASSLELSMLMTDAWDAYRQAAQRLEVKPSVRAQRKVDKLHAEWLRILELSVAKGKEESNIAETKKRVADENAKFAATIKTHERKQKSPKMTNSAPKTTSSGLPSGRKLGKCTLDYEIARGNFGQVWKGTMPHGPKNEPREVAVKVIPGGLLDDSEQERIIQEMVLLSKLNNPHIVSLLDWPRGTKQRAFWFATEYVSEINLQSHIKTRVFRQKHSAPTLELKHLKRYAEQIFTALAAAERKQIIHKDIKPDNLAITRDGRSIKVLDFGLGFVSGKTEAAQTWNRYYSAPEVLAGKREPTHKADIYSVGLTLLSAIRGSDWFGDMDLEEVNRTISHYGPRWDGVPPIAVEFLKPLLAFNPADRPSADRILRHLETASTFIPWPKGSKESLVASRITQLQAERYGAKR